MQRFQPPTRRLESWGRKDSSPGADLSQPPDEHHYPSTLYNAYDACSEEHAQMTHDQVCVAQAQAAHDIHQQQWNELEINYLADQINYDDEPKACYGVSDDYFQRLAPAAIPQLSRSYPAAIPQLSRSYPAAIPQLSRTQLLDQIQW